MKKLALLLLVPFFLVACNKPAVEEIPATEPADTAVKAERVTTLAQLGEACGGTEKVLCDNYALCEFTKDSPDASGVCVDTVADKSIQCGDEQLPLCGIRNGQKNAYQNECQLARHGATKVNDGFCESDPAVAGSCEAIATGIGTCFEVFEGYEFDGKRCQKRFVSGCQAEIPFNTLSECETSCK